MSFEATEENISKLFNTDDLYILPRGQRKYVWTERNWTELFEDLKFSFEDEKYEWVHFLGSFVFEKQKKTNTYFVIDGQQRITTIIIILCVICIIFNELKNEDSFNGTKKYIIGMDKDGIDFIRFQNDNLYNYNLILNYATHYNNDDVDFQKFLDSTSFDQKTIANKNILKSVNYFYKSIKELIEKNTDKMKITNLQRFRDRVLNLTSVKIIAKNTRESYDIFEILNARGIDLEQHELLKNYILKYILPKGSIDEAQKTWEGIEKRLFINETDYLDMFLTHYITHKYEKPHKLSTEFRIVKEKCPKNEVKKLLEDIEKKSSMYKFFIVPDQIEPKTFLLPDDIKKEETAIDGIVKIKESLDFFVKRNHRQFRPLFLSVLSQYKKKIITFEDIIRFFTFIENFYFAFGVVCLKKSNIIETQIYSYANLIEKDTTKKSLQELYDKLKEFYPDETTFINMFQEIGCSKHNKKYKTKKNKINVQYILKKFENYYNNTNELSVNKFSIEHISGDSNNNDICCKIGNLLPLAGRINKNAKDKPVANKIQNYKNSQFNMVKIFLSEYQKKQIWNDDTIIERGKKMAKVAYNNIWKLN